MIASQEAFDRVSTAWRSRVGVVPAVVGVLAAAVVLRFIGLAAQSYWFDEAVTVLAIRSSFFDTMSAVPQSEVTPPLYYAVAWGWTRIFGEHEAGLRSLSSVAGVGTVWLLFVAGQRLHSARAGLAAAAIAAVNPMFVWYSQEARSYALMLLLCAAALILVIRAAQEPSPRRLAAWSVVASAAIATHYFAVFLILAEGLWLLRRRALTGSRSWVAAIGPLLLTGLLLAPLAYRQSADGRAAWIAGQPIAQRANHVLEELLSANTALVSENSSAPPRGWGMLGVLGVLVLIWAAWRRSTPSQRRAAGAMAGVGAVALAVPWLLSATPADFFKDRNVMAAWLPLMLAIGAAAAASRLAAVWRIGALAAILAAGVATCVQITRNEVLQRANWRGAIARLGKPDQQRLLWIQPEYALAPFMVYGRAPHLPGPGSRVREVAVIGDDPNFQGTLPPPLVGFRLVERTVWSGVRVLRYTRSTPQLLDLPTLQRFTNRMYLDTPGPSSVRGT